ncbi:helix-turn-helix transcriptional regulator [Phytomonospora sp. NPDC050363]|uniref:helix-turn-helix domain-containing protein n=1 Tax=Phytomonospora sp. NPDC050363 TaxID=3155642 RepID=UPI0033CA102F
MRWLIGTEMARIRKQAGMTLAEVATATEISKPKIGNMETGRFHQFPEDIDRILSACRADRHDIDRIVNLASQQDAKTWWAPWSNVVPDWFRTYAGLEGLAEAAFMFEPMVIPGLLQTSAYARAVTGGTGFVRPDQTERFVSFRQARAERLAATDEFSLHAVIGLAALQLAVGTVEERREQLRHLLAEGERENVTIQVLRPEDGMHPAGEIGQYFILEFAGARPIAYSEMFDGAIYVQDVDSIETYRMVADNLRQVAQSPAASVKTIKGLLGAL